MEGTAPTHARAARRFRRIGEHYKTDPTDTEWFEQEYRALAFDYERDCSDDLNWVTGVSGGTNLYIISQVTFNSEEEKESNRKFVQALFADLKENVQQNKKRHPYLFIVLISVVGAVFFVMLLSIFVVLLSVLAILKQRL